MRGKKRKKSDYSYLYLLVTFSWFFQYIYAKIINVLFFLYIQAKTIDILFLARWVVSNLLDIPYQNK